MTRVELWVLHISSAILGLTGIAYFVMHYFLKSSDPFSVVNHPWEPYMMKGHILAAPILVVTIGMITHIHILWKLQNGSRTARRSGIFLIPLFLVMVLSGYGLQIITSSSTHSVLVGVHLGSSILWLILYVAHQLVSLSLRRAMARANTELNRR